jgi:hypothetical protein
VNMLNEQLQSTDKWLGGWGAGQWCDNLSLQNAGLLRNIVVTITLRGFGMTYAT